MKLTNLFKTYKTQIILGFVLILSLIGPVEKGYRYVLSDRIHQSNVEYLDKSATKAIIVFATLSGIKAILHVIEGSTVDVSPFGVGGSIQLGDIVEPVLDVVNMGWTLTFISASTLTLSKYLLKLGHSAEYIILQIFLLSLLIWLVIRLFNKGKTERVAKGVCSFILMIYLMLSLFLPLAVRGGEWVSGKVTAKLQEDSLKKIEKMKQELELIAGMQGKSTDNKDEENKKKGLSFSSVINQIKSSLFSLKVDAVRIYKVFELQLSMMNDYIISIIVVFLLDCYILPLLIFACFYFLGKRIIREIFITIDKDKSEPMKGSGSLNPGEVNS